MFLQQITYIEQGTHFKLFGLYYILTYIRVHVHLAQIYNQIWYGSVNAMRFGICSVLHRCILCLMALKSLRNTSFIPFRYACACHIALHTKHLTLTSILTPCRYTDQAVYLLCTLKHMHFKDNLYVTLHTRSTFYLPIYIA